MLTLQESCVLNKVSNDETRFRFLPPGQYRLFIVDSRFQQEVAIYAPRLPTLLKAGTFTINTLKAIPARSAPAISRTKQWRKRFARRGND